MSTISEISDEIQVTESMAKGRYLGNALLEHAETHGRFPTAEVKGTTGKPIGSWRIAASQFFDDNSIPSRFDQSKSWNEGPNLELSKTAPGGLVSPRGIHQDQGFTHFVAVVGKDTVITREGNGTKFAEIRDGTSNTIVAIEWVHSRIPWSKPGDVTPDEAVEIIRNADEATGTMVIYANGSVGRVGPQTDKAKLRGMFTKSGGEPNF